MAITDLNVFLQDYFRAKDCTILENSNGMLRVQLNEEMDRELMNRPFYWHYIKKIGREGDPMQLTLITNPELRDQKGEWIHFGSPRLQQIMNHVKGKERYAKLFQQIDTGQNTALYPWLVINMKISFKGKQKKDEIHSIGLHLVNGKMKVNMMEELDRVDLQTRISDYCFTISPIIKLHSGYLRIENVVVDYVQNLDSEWANDSIRLMKEETEILERFYTDPDDKEQFEKESNEIKERYQPVIELNVINGGIFYLSESFQQ